MKLRKMLLTGILGMTLSVSAVFAGVSAAEAPEEPAGAADRLMEALFGEDGALKDALPEGTDINAMLDTAKEQLGQAGGEVAGVINEVAGALEEELGEIDPEMLKEFAVGLLSQFTEGGDMDFSGWDEIIAIYDSLQKSEEAFILEHNADLLEQGDVQIVSNNHIYTDEFDVDPILALSDMVQYNYRMDDKNQLWIVSAAEDVVLFTHKNDAESDYPITETAFSEDGDKYMPSIEAMCGKVGIDVEQCMEDIGFAKVMVIYDLQQYLTEHPEIVGLEYEGEIRNAEQLQALWEQKLDELAPEEEAEAAE